MRGVYPVAAHVKRELGGGTNVESQYVYTFISFPKRHSRHNCQSFQIRCLVYCTSQSKNEPNVSVSLAS